MKELRDLKAFLPKLIDATTLACERIVIKEGEVKSLQESDALYQALHQKAHEFLEFAKMAESEFLRLNPPN